MKRVANAVWSVPAIQLASAVVRVTEIMRGRRMPTTQRLWGDYAARVAHLPIGLGGRRPINRANVTRDVLLPEWRRVSVCVPWTCSLSQLHARLLLDYDDIFGGCSAALDEDLALEVEGKVAASWRGVSAQRAYTQNPEATFVERDVRVMVQTSCGTRVELYVARSETVESLALRADPDVLRENFRVGTPKMYVDLGRTMGDQDLLDKTLVVTCMGRGGSMKPLHSEQARDILVKFGLPDSQAKKRVDELAGILTPATVTRAIDGNSEGDAWRALLHFEWEKSGVGGFLRGESRRHLGQIRRRQALHRGCSQPVCLAETGVDGSAERGDAGHRAGAHPDPGCLAR